MQGVLCGFDVGFGGRDLAVTDLCYLAVISFAFRHFGLVFECFYTCFLVLDRSHVAFFFVPASVEFVTLCFQFFELFLNLAQLGGFFIAANGLALDLQLFDLAVEGIDLFRFGVHFQTQFGSGFID